jgi:hypothetical protein
LPPTSATLFLISARDPTVHVNYIDFATDAGQITTESYRREGRERTYLKVRMHNGL